jgi:UDP-N-acetylmuramyl pentapeptide synthase
LGGKILDSGSKMSTIKYLEEDKILIITAYDPDSKEWEADWKARRLLRFSD